jgi:Prealbumin-like fold domain
MSRLQRSLHRSLQGMGLVVILGIGLTHGALAADLPKDKCFAFFSAEPKLLVTGDAKITDQERREILILRPNVDQQAYVYAYNPKEVGDSVHVSMHAVKLNDQTQLPAGSEIARTAQPISIGPKQLAKVSLVGKTSAPTPAAAPPATAKTDDKASEPTPSGTKLDTDNKTDAYLFLRVESTLAPPKGTVPLEGYERTQLSISIPSTFQVTPKAANNRLEVNIKGPQEEQKKLLTAQPAKVRLDLRSDLNPLLTADAIVQSTLEADLPLDSPEGVTLFATLTPAVAAKLVELREDKTIPRVTVSIDGYDRAFIIKTNFSGDPKVLGDQDTFVNVRLSSKLQAPGKPIWVTAEADNISLADAPVVVSVNRLGGDKYEVIRKFPTDRQRDVYLRHGEGDAIILRPVVKDWMIEYPTAGAIGKQLFKAERAGKPSEPRELLLDNSKPKKLSFTKAPEKPDCLMNSSHTLEASVEDGESGVAAVWFFTGAVPPSVDGKPASGSKVVRGEKLPMPANTYRMVEPFKLPGTTGEFEVGVLAVNEVGQSSVEAKVLAVIEPPKPKEEKAKDEKPKKTTGSIVVRVLQSTRPQPQLPVTLMDAAGNVVKTATTDGSGSATFKDLQPGEYTLKSVKRADQNANGSATATVEAGDTPANALITIRR